MAATPSTPVPPSSPRVAVIGTGGWGRNLARNLFQLGALCAIAERHPDHRRAVASEFPTVTAYDDYPPILADPTVDAVLVATPAATHFDVVRDALEAGKDVFVEKPLTLEREHAWRLVELAEQQGRQLMVGHLLLFQPAIQWLRDFLSSGQIGTVCSIHQERLGLGRARDRENALWCLGSHDVAVQRYLLDATQVERLDAQGHCILQPQIEDDVYLHLLYENGVQSHLHCSWLWPEKRRSLVVVGTEGMVAYDEIEQTVTLHRKGIDTDLNNRDHGSEVVHRGHDQPLRLEMEHFLACVEHRQSCLCDGRFAAAVVELLADATANLRTPANAKEL